LQSPRQKNCSFYSQRPPHKDISVGLGGKASLCHLNNNPPSTTDTKVPFVSRFPNNDNSFQMKGGGRQNLPENEDGLLRAMKASMDDAQHRIERQRILDQTLGDLIPPDFLPPKSFRRWELFVSCHI
jgi:hypothetical protein